MRIKKYLEANLSVIRSKAITIQMQIYKIETLKTMIQVTQALEIWTDCLDKTIGNSEEDAIDDLVDKLEGQNEPIADMESDTIAN